VLVAPAGPRRARGILRSHARDKTLSDKVDLLDVGPQTTGLTGAQLANA